MKTKDYRLLKTFEDCCADQGKDPKKVIPYENPQDDDEEALNAVAIIFMVNKAINGDWIPDYNNPNQWKYELRFIWKSGFGFSYSYYAGWGTTTGVGSRLCFESVEKALHAFEIAKAAYQKFLTKQNI